MTDPTEQELNELLSDAYASYKDVFERMRVRRLLLHRIAGDDISTGTILPAPFDKSQLVFKAMMGEAIKAAQYNASRIGSNRPDIQVVPVAKGRDVGEKVQKTAAEQERLDAMLWEESGGRVGQWQMGWAQAVGGVGYYLDLPRDATFGLPDRIHYETDTEDAIRELINSGMVSPTPEQGESGKLIYAEAGDVWAARREAAAQDRAVNGTSLFNLRTFPRDQVICERDADGLKWAAVLQEISSNDLKPGSALAQSSAKMEGVKDPRYGLIFDGERIVGGIAEGTPLGENTWAKQPFLMVDFFTRTEHIVLVSPTGGGFTAGKIVYRGKHGATRLGNPVCPVWEVPFTVTDVNTIGQEFASPMEQVFAYIPLINELLTLHSNADAYNLIPRWIVELTDGSTLRGVDGEPTLVATDTTPGLDPKQAAAYPGTLKQLLIDKSTSIDSLKIYLERLDLSMPPAAAQGEGGTSEAAWHAHQMIAQAQAGFRQPVDNHAQIVRNIVQTRHGWLRQLDTPVYFLSAPTARKDGRSIRGLVEFDPKNLTDSVIVSQELDTPEEAVVRIQIGMQLRQAGAIDDETFFADYMKIPDSRQAVIDMYVQQVVSHVMGGIPAPPGSVIATVSDAVRGRLTYQLLQQSPNFAIASAEQAVQMAGANGQAYNPMPMGGPGTAEGGPQGPHPNVADAVGVQMPGMGMANTLQGQLGPRATPPVPVG